jgi:hypothetical protein
MKHITLYFVLLAAICFSCEKDETEFTLKEDGAAPSITSQENGFEQEISSGALGQPISFAWTDANYGVNTQITYVLQLDSVGRDFSHPVSLGSTSSAAFSTTLGVFNGKLVDELKVTPNVVSAVQLRVVASVNNKYVKISEPVSMNIKTYKFIDDKPAMLWLPGGYQDWDPAHAPTITAISETVFEGYVYINAGTGFKFTSDPDWNHINYGDSGTPGILTTDGLANGMSINNAGYYKFKVDVQNLTYEITLINTWGMIGTATPGSWDSSTAMDLNTTTGVWSKTLNLVPGALKFRANNDWGINYGPVDSNVLSGILTQTDGAITISEAGNYTVSIDLGKSKAPYKYEYSVVKN